MGILSKLRGELVDIIEWLEDSRTRLAWRFPRYQNEIKNGAQLIVREGQQAIFVYRGQLADVFGPGSYTLTTENLPLLSTLQGWQHGFNSPFRSEVYFINTRPVTDLRWGTASPVTLRDPDFGMVQVRANGLCILRVSDPQIFLRQVIGTDSQVDIEEISELLRREITQVFSELVMNTGLGAIDLQTQQQSLGDQLAARVQERVDDEFGLTIQSISVNLSLPDEITQAMTRGVARGVEEAGWMNQLGNAQRYQQFKAGQALGDAANNPSGGAAATMMGAGLGIGMAAQMAQAFSGATNANTTSESTPAQTPPPLIQDSQTIHVAIDQNPAGPYTIAQIRSMIENGQVNTQTLVWSAGMAGWMPASQVPALIAFFQVAPPIPGDDQPGTAQNN